MAIRGETIGTAYVRILADGSGLDDSIKREMHKAEPMMHTQGEQHASAYSDGFNKQMKKEDPNRTILERLHAGMGRFDATSHLIGERLSEGLREELEKAFPEDIGATMFRHLEEDLTEGRLNINRLGDELENLRPRLVRAVKEVEKMGRAARLAAEGTEKLIPDDAPTKLHNLNTRLDSTAEKLGLAFGKTSRNDAVNFFGAIVEGIARTLFSIPKLLEKAQGLSKVFTEAGGGIEGFLAVGKQIGPALAKAGPALGGLLLIVGVVIGPLTSMIAGLAGAVIALAGSISFALAGAVGALVGAVLPLAAGVGVAVLAITNLSDTTKKAISEAIDPFKDALHEIGEVAGERLFENFDKQMPKFTKALKVLRPVILGIADALGDVIGKFADLAASPAFKRFADVMGKFLPDAVRQLGDIFANVGRAMLGVFTSLVPITQRFLDWLVNITDEFADWVNTPAGQKRLVEFFERAGDAAETLGDFLGAVGEAIGELLSAGEPTGTGLIESMANAAEDFVAWLETHKGTVRDWFADAGDIARAAGDAIGGIIKVLDSLDTPENRKIAEVVLQSIAVALDAIAVALKVSGINLLIQILSLAISLGTKAGEALLSSVGAIRDWATRVPEMVSRVVNNIVEFFQKLPGRIGEFLQRLPGILDRALNRMLFNVGVMIGKTIKFFIELPGKIASALVRLAGVFRERFLAAVAAIPGIIDRIVGFFRGLPEKIADALVDLTDTIMGFFEELPDLVGDVIGDIVAAFLGLGGKILDAIGEIDISGLIKWPTGKLGQLASGIIEGMHARGGIFTGPTLGMIGEAGPEAVVPLHRSLSQVDPAVRQLSAIAQGLTLPTVSPGRSVTANITVVSPQADPRAVATETVNYLTAVGAY